MLTLHILFLHSLSIGFHFFLENNTHQITKAEKKRSEERKWEQQFEWFQQKERPKCVSTSLESVSYHVDDNFFRFNVNTMIYLW